MLHLPTLTTARLTLRPFTLDDAEALRILASDHAIYRTTANIPHPFQKGKQSSGLPPTTANFTPAKAIYSTMPHRGASCKKPECNLQRYCEMMCAKRACITT
jgi:hypothetical protein